MTGEEKTPECKQGMCHLCHGPKVVRRPGAPAWEAPLMTLRCGCRCHSRRRSAPTSPQA